MAAAEAGTYALLPHVLDKNFSQRDSVDNWGLSENVLSLELASIVLRLEMLQGKENSLFSFHPHMRGERQTTLKTLLSFLAWSNVILIIECKSKQEMPQSICFLIIVHIQENKRKNAHNTF